MTMLLVSNQSSSTTSRPVRLQWLILLWGLCLWTCQCSSVTLPTNDDATSSSTQKTQSSDANPRRLVRGISTSSKVTIDNSGSHGEEWSEQKRIRRQMQDDSTTMMTHTIHGDCGEDEKKALLKRVIIYCGQDSELEVCWNDLVESVSPLRLVHHLPGLYAFAVEVEESALSVLEALGFSVSEDKQRYPLWMEDSLQLLPRRLQEETEIEVDDENEEDGQQQFSYGVNLTKAVDVWNLHQVRGEGVKVCIMDTGVYALHPDLQGQDIDGWNSTNDFVVPWYEDAVGHGTHITGILTAADNRRGYIGMAPDVSVYFVRVFTEEGKFYGSDVVAAAQACQQAGADIISMSLGGEGFDDGEYEIFKELYSRHGIIAVASAGNTGGPELLYPAGYTDVLSVAACDKEKVLASFTTFNSFVDIVAPGVHIPSTFFDSTGTNPEPYASLSGSSMAGPHVAGALALMKSAVPSATADELLYALKESTQPLSTNVNVGLVDALAAVEMLKQGIDLSTQEPPSCVLVELTIETDQWGVETAYRLRSLSDGTIYWRGIGLESNMKYFESSCVDPNDCYEFMIKDAYGDGIMEPGGIELRYDGFLEFEGGEFGSGGKMNFGGSC